MTFGEQLKRWRELAGLSQEQLAEEAGLTAKGISALERGERRHPYPRTVQALAQALHLSPEQYTAWVALLPSRSAITTATTAEEQPAPTPHTIPIPPNELIGRESDSAAVWRFLATERIRLVTLTGPGGVGKTRLGLHIAQQASGRFPDGAAFVSFAALTEPTLLLTIMARALNLPEVRGQSDRQTVRDYLTDKAMLLVLDNFEHVLAAVPDIAYLLATCKKIKILATSRAPLRLQGEQEYPLAPLSLPALTQIPLLEEVEQSPAVRLFVQHAQTSAPNFVLTQANALTISVICRRLDGLPLALELAAARIKLLTTTALLARLDQTLPLLTGGAHDLPERQQTMRQTIAWSYDLLNEEEQQLFRHLSIFAGTWSLEAAEALAAETADPLSGIASLLDKSLLYRVADEAQNGRLAMFQTIRAYALEQLQSAGEQEILQERHLNWYLEFAQLAEKQLFGPEQISWMQEVENELPNIRATLEWAFRPEQSTNSDVVRGLKIASVLYRFWQGRGYLAEGRSWLERGLNHTQVVPTLTRAEGLNCFGWLIHQQGEIEEGMALQHESVALFREAGDNSGVAAALDSLGDAAWTYGDFALAESSYQESLALRRQLGDTHGVALSLYSLGRLLVDNGHGPKAEPLLEEAAVLLNKLKDQRGIALTKHALGRVKLQKGALREATVDVKQALRLFYELGNKIDIAECIETMAVIAKAQTKWSQAVTLWAASHALRNAIGVPMHAAEEAALVSLHELLSAADFAEAWAAGEQQAIDEAVEWILH